MSTFNYCSRSKPVFLLQRIFYVSKTHKKYHFFSTKSKRHKNVLLIGCKGTLGKSIVHHTPQHYKVIGVDIELNDNDDPPRQNLDNFISIPNSCLNSLEAQCQFLHTEISKIMGNKGIDGIFCTAGKFEKDPHQNSILEHSKHFQNIFNANLNPVICASLLSMEFINRNGLFVSIGASAALAPSVGMTAYVTSKAACHNLIQALGNTNSASKSNSFIGKTYQNITSLALLPNCLDTPINRRDMPKSDPRQWVKPDDISTQIWEWMEFPDLRPKSGSLIKIRGDTRNGGALFILSR